MKRVFMLFLACAISLTGFAQSEYQKFNIANSKHDVSLSVGPYMSFHHEDLNNGINLNVDYGHFFGKKHNVGIRTGLNYINRLENGIYLLGIPVASVWKMPLDRGAVIKYEGNNDKKRYHRFMLETNLGVTPSLIMGHGYESKGFDSAVGFPCTKSMDVTKRFCLTGDVGCKVSMRFGKYSIFVQPQYHYRLTNNYSKYIGYSYSNSVSETYIPTRSYFSANLGVSLAL